MVFTLPRAACHEIFSNYCREAHRMNAIRRSGLFLIAMIVLTSGAVAALPRYPNLRNGMIVFVADGNLWQVPRGGGVAQKLTSDPGQDVMPRYSPDGKWIAFTASYQGSVDVYAIPATGGAARRLTFQSDIEDIDKGNGGRMGPNNMVVTWTPDSKSIVFLSRREAWNKWIAKLFAVPVEGGLPVALPLDSGGLLTYGPDGHSIAYNRIFRNFRTWKRYQGALAQQIFTYNFNTQQLTQITDWRGTNTAPMWYGHQIYFLSDRDKNLRTNIWAFDLDTKQTRQITHFVDYDIDFPSLGDDAITFQQGGRLYVLDLPTEHLHALDVAVPDDGTRIQPRTVSVKSFVRKTDNGFFSDDGFDVDYALAPTASAPYFPPAAMYSPCPRRTARYAI
jgi:tricorn protease